MRNRLLMILPGIFLSVIIYAQKGYDKTGMASFYGDEFEGRQTANGEIYYHAKRTAAHRTLPFGSVVKVTNVENQNYVVVRVNDRGPFVDGRIIDLSRSAAKELEFIQKGITKVSLELIANTDDLPGKTKDKIAINKQQSDYYKVEAEKIKLKGKGIQVSSFKNNDNVLRLVDELKHNYNEEVFIEVTQVKKQQLYRIIIGNSHSEEYLNKLKSKLSRDYPGCFIVSFK